MAEFKVRLVDEADSKSKQELESELLAKHEEEKKAAEEAAAAALAAENNNPDNSSPDNQIPENQAKPEINEDDVLSFIKNKYNKPISKIEDLFTPVEKEIELPEDVKAYFDYKKETGRTIEDFVRLNRDLSKADPNELLTEFYLATEEGLDREDITAIMAEFEYDEDIDDENSVKKAKLAKKKAIAKAKKYFEDQKEKFKIPIESVSEQKSFKESEEYKQWQEYASQMEAQKSELEASKVKHEWYLKKTEEVFSPEFKGFEFNVGEKNIKYSPGDYNELKNRQTNPMNFIGKYLDENGLLSDAQGYHRALSIAMNPEKFAKFFYEQGKSDATNNVVSSIKNIDMSQQKAPEVISKGGVQIKEVDHGDSRGLRIKPFKN